MTEKTPEFIWAIDKVDLRQYVHRDTHQALEAERDAMQEALKRPLLPLSFYQEAALQSQKRAEKAEAERDALQEVINQMRAIVETEK